MATLKIVSTVGAAAADRQAELEKIIAHEVGTPTTLSPGERERLDVFVKTVDEGMDTFLIVGAALIGIQEGKLYRETHPTFESFCKERWSMSRPRIYQLIASVKVVNNLSRGMSTTVVKPTHESQVRPLTALPPVQQVEVWNKAVETAPGGKPTAAHVAAVVDAETTPRPRKRYGIRQNKDAPYNPKTPRQKLLAGGQKSRMNRALRDSEFSLTWINENLDFRMAVSVCTPEEILKFAKMAAMIAVQAKKFEKKLMEATS